MLDQRAVRIRYTARDGSTTQRDVEPLLFASLEGRWQLVGWCRLRSAIRWFRLDGIERAVVTASPCSGHSIGEIGVPPSTARSVGG